MKYMRVWAPQAKRVELACSDRLLSMSATNKGWWSVEAPFIEHGVDYAYYVDGEGPFPDPRSSWQPDGVHGPSRWLEHSGFSWSDSCWRPPPLKKAIIYELHIGTFSEAGTFVGAIDHLEKLVNLGITHIELMPIAEFSGNRGWGYDGVNLYAPHHAYGGPEALKHLVDACHRHGLAVLLDVVYNHLGPEGNYLSRFGPYFTERYMTPWGDAVNLDGAGSDEVRQFFIDNSLMWLRDYHFDGLRIDAVHAFLDVSAIHFLEQMATEVGRLGAESGRHLVLIAESDLNDPRVVRSPAAGGYGIDAQWNEDFHHALHTVLTGERNGYYCDFGSLADLAKVLTRIFKIDGTYSMHRERVHGRPAAGLPGSSFVGCLQNHDQIGNRGQGERTSHLLSGDLLKIGAALVMTSPFIPMIFQGEEWAASSPFLYFTDHQDKELAAAVRKGRREEFASFGEPAEKIPDPQAKKTFARSRLDWAESGKNMHAAMLSWHRDLIALRRRMPDLHEGRMEDVEVCFDESAGWLTMIRNNLIVACNFSDLPCTISCCDIEGMQIVLASREGSSAVENELRLLPRSVMIMAREDKQGEGKIKRPN